MATRSSPSGSTFLIVALVCAAFVPCATAAAFDLDTRYLATGWELMPGSPVAQAHLRVPVFLGLKVSDKRMQVLTSTCESVSDPASETYGQYLTRSEVTQLTAASDDTHAAVEAWLASVGASSVSFCKTGDCVTALLTVDAIQDSFGLSNMRWFRSPHGPAVRSTDMVSIPAALSSHVEIVLGVADFPPSRHGSLADRMASVARSLRGESDGVVSPPSTDNEMYPMEPVISIAALTSTVSYGCMYSVLCGNVPWLVATVAHLLHGALAERVRCGSPAVPRQQLHSLPVVCKLEPACYAVRAHTLVQTILCGVWRLCKV